MPLYDRVELLEKVRLGDMSPSMAEKWIRNSGFESVPALPDIDTFKPMDVPKWTLPMAATWFIWRSPDAVRDQWIDFRRAWLANADPTNRKPLKEVSLRRLYRWADLRRFIIRPNQPYGLPVKHLPREPRTPDLSPRRRLQIALDFRHLNVTGIFYKDGARQPITHPRLAAYVDYLMQGGHVSDDRAKSRYLFVPGRRRTLQFSDLLVYRDEVRAADEVASRGDFDEVHWTLEHVLGWIAHRNPCRFRRISPIEQPDKSALGPLNFKMRYAFDFVDHDPEGTLRSALLEEQLEAELDTRFAPRGFPNPIPTEWWQDKPMNEVPRLWFRRDAVLNLWPPISPTQNVSRPVVALEANPPQTPEPRLYSSLKGMIFKIIDIARDLWPDGYIPTAIAKARDPAIIAEYLKRGIGSAPNIKTNPT